MKQNDQKHEEEKVSSVEQVSQEGEEGAMAEWQQDESDANGQDQAIAQLQADLDRFRDLALRSQADLDNFRKRATREREEAIRYANAGLIESLLPVLDNFALGLEAAGQPESGAQSIYQGLGMVHKQLLDVLASSGLEVIEAEGREFDPNLHEAIGQECSEDIPEGVIVRELRKGYIYRSRLLRASNVIVSSGKSAA